MFLCYIVSTFKNPPGLRVFTNGPVPPLLAVPVVGEVDHDPGGEGDDPDTDQDAVDNLLGEGYSGARRAGDPGFVGEGAGEQAARGPGHEGSCEANHLLKCNF